MFKQEQSLTLAHFPFMNSAKASAARNATTCASCNLGQLCLPDGMERDETGNLGYWVKHNNIRQKGEPIYHGGSPFRGIMAVRSGSVKLLNFDNNGIALVVDFILPGELLGFDGMASQSHQCTAVALETVNYCHLPGQWINDCPSLQRALLHRSCAQFNRHIKQLQVHRRAAKAKVACFILQISDRLKHRGYSEHEFRLSMSRVDIGSHLGIAQETVSRIFNHFQSLGILEIKAKNLKIKDKKKLLGFCEEHQAAC